MSIVKIPGEWTVGHHVITDDCRKLHGDEGAYDEAAQRLKEQYLKTYPKWSTGTKFRLVMVLEEAKS